jgi:hypothetical protein
LTSGTDRYGLKSDTLRQNISLEIIFYGFQELSKHIPLSFKDDGLDHIKSNIVYQTIQYY